VTNLFHSLIASRNSVPRPPISRHVREGEGGGLTRFSAQILVELDILFHYSPGLTLAKDGQPHRKGRGSGRGEEGRRHSMRTRETMQGREK